MAASKGNVNAARLLLGYGANPNSIGMMYVI